MINGAGYLLSVINISAHHHHHHYERLLGSVYGTARNHRNDRPQRFFIVAWIGEGGRELLTNVTIFTAKICSKALFQSSYYNLTQKGQTETLGGPGLSVLCWPCSDVWEFKDAKEPATKAQIHSGLNPRADKDAATSPGEERIGGAPGVSSTEPSFVEREPSRSCARVALSLHPPQWFTEHPHLPSESKRDSSLLPSTLIC